MCCRTLQYDIIGIFPASPKCLSYPGHSSSAKDNANSRPPGVARLAPDLNALKAKKVSRVDMDGTLNVETLAIILYVFCRVDTWPTINIFPLFLNVQYRWKLENKFWRRDLAVLLWGNEWTCSMVPWNSLRVRYGLLSTEFPWLCLLTGVKNVAHRGWPCKVISWKQFHFYLFPCKLCSNYPTGRNVSTQKGVWLATFSARHLACGVSDVAGYRLILVGSSYP